MRKIDARWQMYDPGKWGRTRISVATKDYRLMRAVVRAAEGYRDNTANYQVLLDALDALNAPGKGRR